jgi:protoporphyrinogen/coproporphyrinogen III oxidase
MRDLDVAVIGGGVAGLATAYRLRGQGRSPHVFEADSAVGGRMRSRRCEGYLIDEGAETIASSGYPSTWQLIRELGITAPEILPVRSMVALWRDGRAHAGVGHPLGGMSGAGLSVRGRLALMGAVAPLLARARRYDVDHPEATPLGAVTIAEFARGRPRELHDYLLQPAAGTGFGWRPERSTMAPLVATMIATRGIWRWRTYRDGMDTLARRLSHRVPVHVGRRAQEVRPEAGGVRVVFADGEVVSARSVVLAVPAPVALELHPGMPEDERAYASACTYVPMLRVTCLLDRPLEVPKAGRLSPQVYALLVPEREDPVLGGLTVEHLKAANRVPPGRGLISLLPATALTPELLGASDAEVVETLLARGETYLPGLRAACRASFVHRFRDGQPEATPEALGRRAEFVRRPARSVEYAGDWLYLRPSSEGAVRSAGIAVPRVVAASGG